MATHETLHNVYGPGTFADTSFIPLPKDCPRILDWLAHETPGFTKGVEALQDVNWQGHDLPLLPGPLKAQALSAALHAMAGIVGKEIAAMRGTDVGKITIDIDQAGMYPASTSLVSINGKTGMDMVKDGTFFKLGTDLDHGALTKNPWHLRSWSIYPTKAPEVHYQIMSNMDAPRYLKAFGLDSEAPVEDNKEAYDIMRSVFSQYSARELDQKNMEHGFCGQTCYNPQQWRETEMGKRLAAHPLVNYRRVPGTADIPATPFLTIPSDPRPLAGIRVVELARAIAAPALGAVLASFGAEVVKVQSPRLPDPNPLQLTLTAGKYTYPLDLNQNTDRARLWKLLEDADVFLQGFRPRSLERKGFGLDNVLELAKRRAKGIVYLDLSCYGPDGTYLERPGYQQIADSASGASYVFGKAYGFPEGTAVLPSLPVADMLGGLVGAVEVMMALRDRAEHGGSYHCHAALTAVDTIQLVEEMGCYPPEVVKKIQEVHKFGPQTPDLHVEELLFAVYEAWKKNSDLLDCETYFAHFADSPFGKDHVTLAPIVRYEEQAASPYWKHSPVPYLHQAEVRWAT
ncbi:hypothetical protein LTR86_005840 [Recurvomyces mirabilis]|nr:hypothetical protein LTR86_005840 [Recurvomyces mirabilis]